ncbi:helix-turn-helix transcriptional regulator [Xanthobacter agilis]|uniref:helix-turn-helix transcriptional regulator n=1 Tax=Xanthobacter agilis TaxID=47492 RepID=UPI003728476B
MAKDSIRLEKVADLLRLALRLAGSAEGLTLDDIAQEFSVSRRTAERMRDTVRDLFPGFDQEQDGAHLRVFIRGGLPPFLAAPTAVELAELDGQVRALEQAGHRERAAALSRLADKVKAAQRDKGKSRTATDLEALRRAEAVARQVGPRAICDVGTIDLLREALLALKKVRFAYPNTGQDVPLSRLVVPYGLLFGRNAYLVGQQSKHSQPVLWRLDRIMDLEIVDEATQVPADFSLDAYAARSFGTFQEEPAHVVLRFLPAAAAEARRMVFHPTQQLRDLEDGGVEVSFTAGGLLEIAHHLFTWGDNVEIIAPDALRHLMVRELERALARHRNADRGPTPQA